MKQTNLYEEHLKLNAKMAEYAGYMMPIEYKGIKDEHMAVRERVGMFDVSHMGEIRIRGKDVEAFINDVFTNDIFDMDIGQILYGLMCYPNGGVVDDLLVYKFAKDNFLLVVNAANKDKDYRWLVERSSSCSIQITDESGDTDQIAVQGPLSVTVLEEILLEPIHELSSYHFMTFAHHGYELLVSRTGYTGEDGFEIYGNKKSIVELWQKLISKGVEPCGLGCRDTLRFESAMPLYGHELSSLITPLEAGLSFAVKMNKDFIGKEALLAQQQKGLTRRLVGIELTERGIPRQGYAVYAGDTPIGEISTGYMLPNSNKPLGLALIKTEFAKIGTPISVDIRGRKVAGIVRDKRFYQKRNKM